MNKVFITGTDTDVGKTITSALILKKLKDHLLSSEISYFKPIQTGAKDGTDSQFIKSNVANINIVKESYVFKEPLSPNRAADLENRIISIQEINDRVKEINKKALIIEGAGGLMVPISEEKYIFDIPIENNIPVILVASTKLGTINHTLLSIDFCKLKKIEIYGVVLFGRTDPGLKQLIEEKGEVKVIGEISGYKHDINKISHYLNLEAMINPPDNIWYPYTQHRLIKKEFEVSDAYGAYLNINGYGKVFDGISSWWTKNHGHRNPAIISAMKGQLDKFEHCALAGLTHIPAKKLAKLLLHLLNSEIGNFEKVFFSDNGSTSVEVALKLAYQFWQLKGVKRQKILAIKGSYHGDTLGAMSVSDRSGFNTYFENLLFDVDFIDLSNLETSLNILSSHAQEYAACIIEPLIQGAMGMNIYSEDKINQIVKFCKDANILIIFDEVFTGFGRLGKNFAFEIVKIRPDIICLSKGISGGTMPFAATAVTKKIFECFFDENLKNAFLHGHSYTGNPIGAAASIAQIELLKTNECQNKIKNISELTRKRIKQLEGFNNLEHTRSIGTIGAFNLIGKGDYFSSDFSYQFFLKAINKGVYLRPLGNVIYVVPPFCSTDDDINFCYDKIEELVNEFR